MEPGFTGTPSTSLRALREQRLHPPCRLPARSLASVPSHPAAENADGSEDEKESRG
jgi:hypothetical protein